MALIAYPTRSRHQKVQLRPVASALVNRSTLTNARQAVDTGYSWWEAEIAITPMVLEDAREWRLFLGRLRGPVNSFRLPVTATAQHDLSYIARAQGAGGGYTLLTDGWPVSTAALPAGDYVTVGSQLMELDADVVTDALGVATLQFHSPLRGTVADNTLIETKRPFLTAYLPDGSPALTLDLAHIQTGFGFAAMEAY